MQCHLDAVLRAGVDGEGLGLRRMKSVQLGCDLYCSCMISYHILLGTRSRHPMMYGLGVGGLVCHPLVERWLGLWPGLYVVLASTRDPGLDIL